MTHRFIVYLSFGCIAGIVIADSVLVMWASISSLTLVCACVAVALLAQYSITKRKIYIALVCSILGLVLGLVRYESALHAYHHAQSVVVSESENHVGEVRTYPDMRDSRVEYDIVVQTEGTGEAIIRVRLDRGHHYRYGDQITFSGSLETPQDFITETGQTVPYTRLMRADGVHAVASFAEVESSLEGKASVMRSLYRIREYFSQSVELRLAEPYAGLGLGITTGEAHALGTEETELFRAVGLSHIVVLSGYNMAIIAQALSSLLAFLPRSIAILGGGIGILLFTLLSGATATAVRAALMATLVLVSKLVYRPQLGLRLLCVTGISMLLYNPFLLLDSLSFQLSFLATASIMTFQHTLQESRMFIAYIPNAIRELLATTIAALIGVLPLLMYTFHATSVIAPLSNILVLPVIPFAMFCVFMTGTFASIPIIPVVFSWMGELLLRYVFVVSNVLSYIPGSLVTVEWVSLSVMFLMYGALVYIGYRVLNTQLQETNPTEGRIDVIL